MTLHKILKRHWSVCNSNPLPSEGDVLNFTLSVHPGVLATEF